MKKSANGNIFEAALEEVWELFEEHLSGSHSALICVISSERLGKEGRSALENSAAALGYGDAACTFITLETKADVLTDTDVSADGSVIKADVVETETDDIHKSSKDLESKADELDAQALFLLVEGLDPLCLIATDTQAIQTLKTAYHCSILPDQACRVFGRPCVAFTSFTRMLNDDQDKQIAWALLKHLPKFGDR